MRRMEGSGIIGEGGCSGFNAKASHHGFINCCACVCVKGWMQLIYYEVYGVMIGNNVSCEG